MLIHRTLHRPGPTGWVSTVATDSTQLWSNCNCRFGRCFFGDCCFARKFNEDSCASMQQQQQQQQQQQPTALALAQRSSQFSQGLIVQALREVMVLSGPSPRSRYVKTLVAGSLAQVLDAREDRDCGRIRIRDSGGQEGWARVAAMETSSLLWCKRTAVSPTPHGQCWLQPYQECHRDELLCIERDCFSKGEQLLQRWIELSAQPPFASSIDVASIAGIGVVGYCAWEHSRGPSYCNSVSDALNVLSIAVEVGVRGCRIGEFMLRQVAEVGLVRFPDVPCVLLKVREDNLPGQSLYARLGFRRFAVVHEYYDDCDAWDMMLQLGPMLRRPLRADLVARLSGELGFTRAEAEVALRWTRNDFGGALALLTGAVPELARCIRRRRRTLRTTLAALLGLYVMGLVLAAQGTWDPLNGEVPGGVPDSLWEAERPHGPSQAPPVHGPATRQELRKSLPREAWLAAGLGEAKTEESGAAVTEGQPALPLVDAPAQAPPSAEVPSTGSPHVSAQAPPAEQPPQQPSSAAEAALPSTAASAEV